MRKKVEVIVGTNEEFILGYEVTQQQDGKVMLRQTFADHSHNSSVRQVVVGGKILASGAADELIRIFNLAKRTEVGIIMEHQGTISSLAFHGTSHLFSAAEDGNICIYKQGKWQCEKTLRGHKGGVVSLAVHPSGKLALSLGRDNTLRTWNLIKGRKAYITKLKAGGDAVYWSPKGTQYLVVKGSCVDIYGVDTGHVEHSIDFKESVSSLTFITDDIIAVGGEGRNICLYDISTKMEMGQWAAHTSRIKCLCTLPGMAAEELWLVSASSDGIIKIWSLELLSLSSEPKLLGEVKTSCRIICMAVYVPPYTPPVDTDSAAAAEYASSEGEEEEEEVTIKEEEKEMEEINVKEDEEEINVKKEEEINMKEEEEEEEQDIYTIIAEMKKNGASKYECKRRKALWQITKKKKKSGGANSEAKRTKLM